MSALDRVPGLAGFLSSRDRAAQKEAGDLQKATAVQGILAKLLAQQKEAEFRKGLADLGPEPDQGAMAALASRYASPETVLKTQQSSLDRKATADATRAMREATFAQQAHAANLMHEYRMRTAATDEARAAEVARHNREIEEIKKSAGPGGNPYFTPVYDKEGVLSFDARKGTATPLVVNGRQAVRSADDPALQGNLAGAKKAGAASAERAFNMEGIGSVIKQAEALLTGKTKPTGSGVGSLVDTAAGFVGMSPTGAKEAQTLKAVAGALTTKMPRMEGPQSDRDTVLYREMAAEVGNDTVPIERRLAALQAVKNLWLKYERLNPEGFAPAAPPAAGGGWAIRPLP